ncbi:MAG: hypothetical protein O2817_13405 [Proteobacteria bacterium]|nr:hypothetical protein [Pseudomonadota bacterium]
MPTIERRKRERLQKADSKMMATSVANASDHIKKRLGQPSTLSEQLHTKGQHNAGWAKYDEYGNPLPREDPKDLGANSNRKSKREDDALDIRDRHLSVWGKHGVAKRIAHEEGLSVETIRSYMRDYPI